MAGTAFGKVGLREDVLDPGDGTYFSLVVDVLKLVHLVGLINNSIAFFKVNQLVFLAVLLKGIRSGIINIIILRLILWCLRWQSCLLLGLRRVGGFRSLDFLDHFICWRISNLAVLLLRLLLQLLRSSSRRLDSLLSWTYSLLLVLISRLQVRQQILHQWVQSLLILLLILVLLLLLWKLVANELIGFISWL